MTPAWPTSLAPQPRKERKPTTTSAATQGDPLPAHCAPQVTTAEPGVGLTITTMTRQHGKTGWRWWGGAREGAGPPWVFIRTGCQGHSSLCNRRCHPSVLGRSWQNHTFSFPFEILQVLGGRQWRENRRAEKCSAYSRRWMVRRPGATGRDSVAPRGHLATFET